MKIRLKNALSQPTKEKVYDVVDILMLVLVTINLTWIIFDWIFANQLIQQSFEQYTPGFYKFYKNRIHEHFIFYDMIFVAIFIGELLIRWAISIKDHEYQKWYFYPFVHWYDVLGAIPIGSLRALRLLRIISLVIRLQKNGVIDLTDTGTYQFFRTYYNALVEEVTDRVIIRALNSIQEEIRENGPVSRKITLEVVDPRRDAVAKWLSSRMSSVAFKSYLLHKRDMRVYVNQVITEALESNPEIATLERVPAVGKVVSQNLIRVISDIVLRVVEKSTKDFAINWNKELASEAVDMLFETVLEEPKGVNEIIQDMALQAIDIVKAEVKIQRWREHI